MLSIYVARTVYKREENDCITYRIIRHWSFRPIPFIYYFSSLQQFRLSLLAETDPSSYRRKIALMSDRKWQADGGQRKRKKLVSKGKLISGHFVSTRSQPSSALSLLLLCIEYSRFFVHHPFSCI